MSNTLNEIWRRIFPEALPRDELKLDQLARLHVSGGNIRNIALNAASPGAFLQVEVVFGIEPAGPLGSI